jgi:hypothetical protein
MVSQCVNPDCGAPFVYMRNGRLFAVPRKSASITSATVEYFWLCERCAEIMQPDFGSPELHFTLITRHSRETHHYR